MKAVSANSDHQALRRDLIDLIRKRHGGLSAQEVLAVAAQLVGQILLMQDREHLDPQSAMDLINRNIVLGNQAALADLQKGPRH